MKNAFAAIDCQLSHILGHAVHGGYPTDFLRNLQQELLGVYWALEGEIERREPPAIVTDDRSPARGLLDFLLPADGAA